MLPVLRATGEDGAAVPAGLAVGRLKTRAEFLHVGKGRRWHGVAMTVQMAKRGADKGDLPRFGFTLTKKVGNAVVRNRARRRLREAVRLAAADLNSEGPAATNSAVLAARPGHDYVLIGRIDALRCSFAALRTEIVRGVAAVHGSGGTRDERRRSSGGVDGAGQGASPGKIRPRS